MPGFHNARIKHNVKNAVLHHVLNAAPHHLFTGDTGQFRMALVHERNDAIPVSNAYGVPEGIANLFYIFC